MHSIERPNKYWISPFFITSRCLKLDLILTCLIWQVFLKSNILLPNYLPWYIVAFLKKQWLNNKLAFGDKVALQNNSQLVGSFFPEATNFKCINLLYFQNNSQLLVLFYKINICTTKFAQTQLNHVQATDKFFPFVLKCCDTKARFKKDLLFMSRSYYF